MEARKQDFDGQELAMLFQAFSKKLFTRPSNGDIFSISHKEDSGCTFYFNIDYYNQLKEDIQNAYEEGSFAKSNANRDWINLMNTVFSAVLMSELNISAMEDYYEAVSRYWP